MKIIAYTVIAYMVIRFSFTIIELRDMKKQCDKIEERWKE